jgi:cytochrome c biogenesis protein CcdA
LLFRFLHAKLLRFLFLSSSISAAAISWLCCLPFLHVFFFLVAQTEVRKKERKKENPSLPQLLFFPCEKLALVLALFVFGFSAALWGLVTTDWRESVRVVLGFCNSEVGKSLKLSFSLFLSLSLYVSGGEDFQKGLVDGGSRSAAQVG